MASLLNRHASKIVGMPSCFDRVVIQGTILSGCHGGAVATLLEISGSSITARCSRTLPAVFVLTPTGSPPRKAWRLSASRPKGYRRKTASASLAVTCKSGHWGHQGRCRKQKTRRMAGFLTVSLTLGVLGPYDAGRTDRLKRVSHTLRTARSPGNKAFDQKSPIRVIELSTVLDNTALRESGEGFVHCKL